VYIPVKLADKLEYYKEVELFLERHLDVAFFLCSNLQLHGHTIGPEPYSSTYTIVLFKNSLVAVFSESKGGNLLVQLEKTIDDDKQRDDIINVIFQSVNKKNLKGIMGEANTCEKIYDLISKSKLWSTTLKKSSDPLLFLNLEKLIMSNPYPHLTQESRLFTETEFNVYSTMFTEFSEELTIPNNFTEPEKKSEFFRLVNQKRIWGHVIGGKIVSMARLNAVVNGLGVVGGVFTEKNFRRQGASTGVLTKLIFDSKMGLGLRGLVLWTDVHGGALGLYKKLGFVEISKYGMIFGELCSEK